MFRTALISMFLTSAALATFGPVDKDGDGIDDSIDNCYLYNPDQADCNENGIGDVCDIADQTTPDCDQNGVPDECQPDCDGDGWIDPCDTEPDIDDDGIPDNCEEDCNGNGAPDHWEIEMGWAEDCNSNNVPDSCEEDCNDNGIPDECDIEDGISDDVDGDNVPDECEGDCNGNGVPDHWDIKTGWSQDCNDNGIPDECDIEDGISDDVDGDNVPDECEGDCNGNGVPDHWDIKTGWSQDCNDNGIPDECEFFVDVITQNPTCDIDENTMVSCFGSNIYYENWFARNFYIDHDVTINSISWGVDDVANITAEFYFSIASGPGNPDYVTLTQVGSAVQSIDGGPWYTTPVDIPFNVVEGYYLVVEVRFPETDEVVIVPAGTSTATGPTYIKTDGACGLSTYVDLADIGYPDAQIVMCLNEIGAPDCNGNMIPDVCDIAEATSDDINEDGIPDECQCFPDLTGDGVVNIEDLLSIIGYWGSNGPIGDINFDGIVDVTDLLIVVGNWGPCE